MAAPLGLSRITPGHCVLQPVWANNTLSEMGLNYALLPVQAAAALTLPLPPAEHRSSYQQLCLCS